MSRCSWCSSVTGAYGTQYSFALFLLYVVVLKKGVAHCALHLESLTFRKDVQLTCVLLLQKDNLQIFVPFQGAPDVHQHKQVKLSSKQMMEDM
eukprot:m.778981 g.778981  ORF g.778981 m.778981 type:complete len:93 (+) comp23276_c1_seq2:127-405(+)